MGKLLPAFVPARCVARQTQGQGPGPGSLVSTQLRVSVPHTAWRMLSSACSALMRLITLGSEKYRLGVDRKAALVDTLSSS